MSHQWLTESDMTPRIKTNDEAMREDAIIIIDVLNTRIKQLQDEINRINKVRKKLLNDDTLLSKAAN